VNTESIPVWAILVAGALGIVHLWHSYDVYRFEQPDRRQFNTPQVVKDSWRFGRRTATLEIGELEPEQLVAFRTPRSGGDLVARVVALEGQRVRIEAGKVSVDGQALDEEYAQRAHAGDHFPEIVVPEGCAFVLNDQRGRGGDALDSRTLGPIPLLAITHRFAPTEKVGGRRR